jgi:hypothetical protein
MTEELHIPEEFTHTLKVLENGAVKYGPNSWLNGTHFDVHKNHKSMSHHLLESYRELRKDPESGLDPLLHLATRALMEYTLRARGRIDKDGYVKSQPISHYLVTTSRDSGFPKVAGTFFRKDMALAYVNELLENGHSGVTLIKMGEQ